MDGCAPKPALSAPGDSALALMRAAEGGIGFRNPSCPNPLSPPAPTLCEVAVDEPPDTHLLHGAARTTTVAECQPELATEEASLQHGEMVEERARDVLQEGAAPIEIRSEGADKVGGMGGVEGQGDREEGKTNDTICSSLHQEPVQQCPQRVCPPSHPPAPDVTPCIAELEATLDVVVAKSSMPEVSTVQLFKGSNETFEAAMPHKGEAVLKLGLDLGEAESEEEELMDDAFLAEVSKLARINECAHVERAHSHTPSVMI